MKAGTSRKVPHWRAVITAIWLGIASLFLVWQSMSYRGLPAKAAEWQFNTLGYNHPAITYIVFLAILGSPLLLLRLGKRESKFTRSADESEASGRGTRGLGAKNLLFAMAIAGTFAALVVLLFAVALPSGDGPVHEITLSKDSHDLPLGAANVKGRVLLNQISVRNESLFGLQNNTRFAPMIAGGADATRLQLFVELPPDASLREQSVPRSYRGVLRHGGLPGDLVRLYELAGMKIDPSYYVLYASTTSMRREYLFSAIELLLLALVAGVVGAIVMYRPQWFLRERLPAADSTAAL